MSQIPPNDRSKIMQDLDLSFMSVDSRENIVHKTPDAGLVAAQTYLIATQPASNDKRAALHLSTLYDEYSWGFPARDYYVGKDICNENLDLKTHTAPFVLLRYVYMR
jgi:hypothetical protein